MIRRISVNILSDDIFSSLPPPPYPTDISFVLICHSLRMYEKKFDKGFLGNFSSFVHTSTVFRRSHGFF